MAFSDQNLFSFFVGVGGSMSEYILWYICVFVKSLLSNFYKNNFQHVIHLLEIASHFSNC